MGYDYFLPYHKIMSLKKIFGNNVRSYRKLRDLSQEQLAEKLDISVKHLSTMETGKVFASAELIEKIAVVLNVSVSSLFYTVEEKSFDESDFAKIDCILEQEFLYIIDRIKKKIRTEIQGM